MAYIIVFLAVFWSVFQLYTSGTGILDAMRSRAVHIIFLLVFTFLLYPVSKRERNTKSILKRPPILDLILILLSIVSFGYLLFNYNTIALRGGYLETPDYIFGAIGILAVFEAARRVVGNLAILALIFLLYNFLGVYIPGNFGHSGFSINRVIEYMFWGSQGISRDCDWSFFHIRFSIYLVWVLFKN